MIPIYRSFAKIYDIFMSDVPYDKWAAYVESIWQHYDCRPKLVLELACGSGNITHRLSSRGYDMIGLDNSADMLALASEKAYMESVDILYLLQDMREFELYGTVDSIVCLCDGMNYLLKDDDMRQVFRLVKNYLNPNGLFVFDMNTEYKFSHVLNDNSFCETEADAAYIWENEYSPSDKINTYNIDFFIKSKNDLYERFSETHFQKAYSINAITDMLQSSGLQLKDVFDECTFIAPVGTSERIYFVAGLCENMIV